jgi:glycosyltransferase involved in cell wall biosynthesis
MPHLISILIPIRNEARYIKNCLDSILVQDYCQELCEILVVDGMSTDQTREIIKEYRQKNSHINLIENPGRIVPIGMNLALRQAKGDIIIRIDGHCIIASDYISKCVIHLMEDGVDGVGGPTETIGETEMAKTIAFAMSSPFGVGNSAFRTIQGKTMLVDSIPFPAYIRQIIQKVGLYDEELVRDQDDEYNYRIREFGGKLLLAEDIKSKYYSRGTLAKLWKQYFQYGYYKVRVLQKHPRQMRLRQFVPPVFVIALLGSILLSIFLFWGWVAMVLVCGSYLLANFIASVVTAAKKGWKHLLLLPLCFAILHVSYGIGFLCGLAKFWNRWGDKMGKVLTNGFD